MAARTLNRDSSLTVAVCASLLLHGSVVYWLALAGLKAGVYLPGVVRHPGDAAVLPKTLKPSEPPKLEAPPTYYIPPPQAAAPAPAAEAVPVFREPEIPLTAPILGEADGKGQAVASSPGDKPQQAREGSQDQPFLSRDPVGKGSSENQPGRDTNVAGENGKPGQPAITPPSPAKPTASPAAAPIVPQNAPQPDRPFGVQEQAETKLPAPKPKVEPKPVETPAPQTPPEKAAAKAPEPTKYASALDRTFTIDRSANITRMNPQPPREQRPPEEKFPVLEPTEATKPPVEVTKSNAAAPPPVASTPPNPMDKPPTDAPIGDGRKPGSKGSPADPAPESDTESDPFSKAGSVTITAAGKVEARFGRKAKIVRPRVGEAGRYDLFQMGSPSVVLKLSVDKEGKVQKVEVARSSGSTVNVDLPCVRAAYEWYIEPPKDAAGQPIADTLLFTVTWR